MDKAMTSHTRSDSRLRIAYIVPMLRGHGGWATFARGALAALSPNIEPVLIVGETDEAIARAEFPAAEIHAVPVVFPEDWSGTSASMLRRMFPSILAVRRLPRLHVAAVHSLEMFPAGWLGCILARREQVPLILTAHGTYAILWSRLAGLNLAYRAVLRSAAAICSVSQGTLDHLTLLYQPSLRKSLLHVISNGTDAANRISRNDAEGRNWPYAPIVLTVGAVKPRKGHATSLRAFAILQRQFPRARYCIAGRLPDAEYRRELEEIIREEGIQNAEFLGLVVDKTLDRLYRKASMFILLSEEENLHFEGFGLAYLEAGAYGLPVIGTRTGGIPDAIQDGATGILVAPSDPTAAGDALCRLASDADFTRRMGMAGRDQSESFTWQRFAEQQMAVYQSVIH
jgi:phosphatidyl-myo-inositol dimannoside synthase